MPPVQVAVPFWLLQTLPQVPQLLTSVPVAVSQFVPVWLGQCMKPALQLPTAHWPCTHAGVPFAVLQMFPQVPQLFGSVCVLASQPSLAFWLQSCQPPDWQTVMLQAPALQASVAWFELQTSPQLPQFWTSPGVPPVFTGQPWIGGWPQLLQPVLHESWHTPFVQIAVEFGPKGHWLPQLPQLFESVLVFTSQPFAATVSQFAKPALQLTSEQSFPLPLGSATQFDVEFDRLQMSPQKLQSLLVPVIVLQLFGMLAGLQKPFGHAGTHTPAWHALFVGQTLPQVPQLFGSCWVLASQPSAAIPLQSVKPVAQVPMVQTPLVHAGVLLFDGHVAPHALQFIGSFDTLKLQPVVLLSQFLKPMAQVPMVHAPIEQAAAALLYVGQAAQNVALHP
jgi:hypothetical protein